MLAPMDVTAAGSDSEGEEWGKSGGHGVRDAFASRILGMFCYFLLFYYYY